MFQLMFLVLPLRLDAVSPGTAQLMRSEVGIEHSHLSAGEEASLFGQQQLKDMDRQSLLQRNVRSSTGGDCVVADTTWQHANSTSKPGVIFYDLGVEAGQSTLMMLGQTVEDSCEYAADKRLAGGWEVCKAQNTKVKHILEDVQEKARTAGFDIFKDQKVVMVEAGPQYVSVMGKVQDRFPQAVSNFVPFAVTAGHDDQNATGLLYNPHRKTIMPGMVAEGNQDENVKVKPYNLMRLLTNTARREDYVVLKMDVEGAEYDIVPCLINSPAAELVDVFLLERHDHFAGSKPEELTQAMHTLQDKGVIIRQDWP